MTDLALVDTDELAAEILRRGDVGVICYAKEKMLRDEEVLVGWHTEGDFRACIGLMVEVSHNMIAAVRDTNRDCEDDND